MLYTIIVVLIVLWLLGLIAHIGGALIHLLLVAALVGIGGVAVREEGEPQ